MKKILFSFLIALNVVICFSEEYFPDGTVIPGWFYNYDKIKIEDLGKPYNIADYGAVNDSFTLNTEIIQQVIDLAAEEGGGVVVIPEGVYLSGALFFKPGTHLHVKEGGTLLGSDTIIDYPKQPSRMEGQNLEYFPALVNAYHVEGFTISGKGTIDGNGLKYWEAFWQRRKENPRCTNLEVSRPRLVFIWGSNNVQIQDVKLHNTGFWTTHFYKCNNVKVLHAHIFAPKKPVPAPSSDAIDIDVCTNVLIKGCYMSVNDDAIALKGGKGPWADTDTNNGPNFNIIIEDCNFDFNHSIITCGSESIHDRNVILRNCTVKDATRLIFLKMRPDTPQKYEYITIDNVSGKVKTFIYIRPWKQFFDLKGREAPPISVSQNITFKNINLECNYFALIEKTEHDRLVNFTLENIDVKADNINFNPKVFDGITLKNVIVNGEELIQ